MFLAVWWVWIDTTWVLNWLDPDAFAVRDLLFGMMGAGLFLSMAVPDAFGSRAVVFAGAYVAMQLGRSLYMLLVVWPDPGQRSTNASGGTCEHRSLGGAEQGAPPDAAFRAYCF